MNENHSEHSHHDRGNDHCQHKHEHGDRAGAAAVIRGKYTCPMHSEVVSDKRGDCPKCGMALELKAPTVAKTIYTCPMHPEIEQDHPGDCPICGMPLEPKTVGFEDSAEHAAIESLSRKFWIGLAFTVPVLFIAMGHLIPGLHIERWIPKSVYNALGVPIAAGVLYPFFGVLLSPIIAGAAMSFSSLSVVANALRLRSARIEPKRGG